MFIKACDTCQRTSIKSLKFRHYHPRILVAYFHMECLSADIKLMLKGFDDLKYLLDAICEITNFILAIPTKSRNTTNLCVNFHVLYGPMSDIPGV